LNRGARPRKARGRSRVGERFSVDVGAIAHGGFAIARLAQEGGRVLFVRHAVPGERVVAEITEGTEGDSFWRADAVEVLTPSKFRVAAPCPVARPGGCGGCDFQHVALGHQRELKAEVVREQLRRLAGLDREVVVEAVPGDVGGLNWRTRVRFALTEDGRPGMRQHRSQLVVPVERCLIARPDAREPVVGAAPVVERVDAQAGTHSFEVSAAGFWQVHPGAPAVLVDAVLGDLDVRPGERALDLYSGVGLFARFLADAVGESGRDAVRHARLNLGATPWARVVPGAVNTVLTSSLDEPFDLVVLDPPRQGAKRAVVAQIVDRAPRAVSYVACDPAALARDVAIFAEHGYDLAAPRAFDLFPMTHHVECVALLTKTGSDLR
jgi:tRNA/tmRNA/rRNA uracil-C5-methylase (TrmA/RlmC/RlmD family)